MNLLKKKDVSTVAVVDHDAATRDSFEALLSSFGYGVRTYASGTQFLNAVSTMEASCALLNVHLPDLNGREVLQRISRLEFNIPTVLMTARPKFITESQARALGAFGMLELPIEAATLSAMIATVLDDTLSI